MIIRNGKKASDGASVKQENSGSDPLVLPGLRLRKARTEKTVSIEQAAEALGLTARTLKALEADDYSKLPAPVYIRGYIRRYCALLDIEASAVLEDFEQLVEMDAQQDAEQQSTQVFERLWLRTAIIFGVAILLLSLAFVTLAEDPDIKNQPDYPLHDWTKLTLNQAPGRLPTEPAIEFSGAVLSWQS